VNVISSDANVTPSDAKEFHTINGPALSGFERLAHTDRHRPTSRRESTREQPLLSLRTANYRGA
jgi:hypothetical protein